MKGSPLEQISGSGLSTFLGEAVGFRAQALGLKVFV